jgi:hypothetical protein
MLRDLMWAMHEGDRDGGGTLSKHEFRGILSKFRLHMKSEGGIVSIVQRYTDKHGELSDDNMRRVMMEVTSAPEDYITADDILRVRKLGGGQKEVIQNFNLLDKTGPSQTMQINVDHLARAIDRVRFYYCHSLRRAPAASNAADRTCTRPPRAPPVGR